MADWTELDVNNLLPGEPWTSAKALAVFENARAMGEGADGGPVVRAGWHPYNLTTVGGSQTGLIYDNAVDGDRNNIDTPDFEVGYSYAIRMEALGRTGTTTITVSAFRSVTGSYSSGVDLVTAATNLFWGVLEIPFPRVNKKGQGVFSSTGLYVDAGTSAGFIGALAIPFGNSTVQNTQRLRLNSPSGSGFNSGRAYLLRRREYVTG